MKGVLRAVLFKERAFGMDIEELLWFGCPIEFPDAVFILHVTLRTFESTLVLWCWPDVILSEDLKSDLLGARSIISSMPVDRALERRKLFGRDNLKEIQHPPKAGISNINVPKAPTELVLILFNS